MPIRFEVVHATHTQGVADVGNLPVAPNLPPTEGLRFFGRAYVEGATESMTGERKDLDDRVLHSVELAPAAASMTASGPRRGVRDSRRAAQVPFPRPVERPLLGLS